MSLKLKGFDEFQEKLDRIKKTAPKKLGLFLMRQAEETVGDVKRHTPVDTGSLKGGWQRENAGSFKQVIYNDVEYARHVEYGHRVGKSKTKVKKGARMLRKGMATRRIKFYKDLKVAFKEVFDK